MDINYFNTPEMQEEYFEIQQKSLYLFYLGHFFAMNCCLENPFKNLTIEKDEPQLQIAQNFLEMYNDKHFFILKPDSFKLACVNHSSFDAHISANAISFTLTNLTKKENHIYSEKPLLSMYFFYNRNPTHNSTKFVKTGILLDELLGNAFNYKKIKENFNAKVNRLYIDQLNKFHRQRFEISTEYMTNDQRFAKIAQAFGPALHEDLDRVIEAVLLKIKNSLNFNNIDTKLLTIEEFKSNYVNIIRDIQNTKNYNQILENLPTKILKNHFEEELGNKLTKPITTNKKKKTKI